MLGSYVARQRDLSIATNKSNLQYFIGTRVESCALNVKAHDPIARDFAQSGNVPRSVPQSHCASVRDGFKCLDHSNRTGQ